MEKKRKSNKKQLFLIGTKTGKCDICKTTKKILLLKYGFNLCEDCLIICTGILEQIQVDTAVKLNKNEVAQ